ncbi:organic solute transporter Ostalpha-domain-containing protein, partial [Ephemerocybe angulata]
MPCEASENQLAIDESKFWDADGIHWSPHRIGWAIAGGCTALTVIISVITVLQHCRNYTNPRQQRQILRILYMPPVYAAISFLSYRFFRYYTYYSFIYIIYEAITLGAFLMLLIEYVAATATGNSADKAIERKDKRPLPLPFCCWRYRPTKAYFMYTVKWSVMQYIIVRPAASVAGIVCEHYHVLCHTEGYSLKYASVYIESINFVSISIALYGLLVFYGLMAEELKGKRPVAKFLSIKLIVMFTFYQAFVFKALQGRVIHATTYWTETNIANGLNALAICVEMVIFAGLMWWAYTAKEYTRPAGTPATGMWKPLWDSINYMDFFREIGYSFRFFFTRKPHPESVPVVETKSSSIPYQATPSMQYRTVPQQDQRMSFAEAFGIAEYQQHPQHQPRNEVAGNAYPLTARNSDPEERQRLRPAVSPNLEPTFPQQQLQPGVEMQRPLSEGEELDLGYYSSAAYEGIEEAAYPQ